MRKKEKDMIQSNVRSEEEIGAISSMSGVISKGSSPSVASFGPVQSARHSSTIMHELEEEEGSLIVARLLTGAAPSSISSSSLESVLWTSNELVVLTLEKKQGFFFKEDSKLEFRIDPYLSRGR